MSSIAKVKTTTDIKVLEEGTYIAICDAVIDVGQQETPFGKNQEQVWLRFEVPTERVQYIKDGEEFDVPLTICHRYNKTLTKKSYLRNDLEAWRGKEFTTQELHGFDLFNLVGKPCLLTVLHNNANNRVYANVAGITKVLRGQDIPSQELVSIRFSPESTEQYNDVPEWLREKYDNRIKPIEAEKVVMNDFVDDDIPF